MSDYNITKTRFFAGVWEGVVACDSDPELRPQIEVNHLGRPLVAELTTSPNNKDEWDLRIPVDPTLLSDGVQVFLIIDRNTGEKLESFTIITGEPLEDDIRAETELLRAELDMLKRAFRRHCLETE
ncbi:MAG: hypothetical protein COB40_09475 [Marinosulfonomonas sp.]|nr:MAG: hypothetical protein COB40_09475 [Marinosulfonomonas sp.]